MRAGFAGPFGDRIVVQPSAAVAGLAPASRRRRFRPGCAQGGGLSDAFILQMLDVLMRRGTPRTALVFTHAEETLRHFEVNRGLAQFFADKVVAYRRNAEHSCVLLFRGGTLDAGARGDRPAGRHPGAHRRGPQAARPAGTAAASPG